jgi:hypothetical protein
MYLISINITDVVYTANDEHNLVFIYLFTYLFSLYWSNVELNPTSLSVVTGTLSSTNRQVKKNYMPFFPKSLTSIAASKTLNIKHFFCKLDLGQTHIFNIHV